ncbi:MAG: hypothetical protein HY369_01125 [Candidatus Aenigmarchaeota archaeon]|nr:hypothetical protein [Candidatus Aenigmarchaeota archaeon]
MATEAACPPRSATPLWVISGAVFLALGLSLWKGLLSLEQAGAAALVFLGLKHLFLPYHYRR